MRKLFAIILISFSITANSQDSTQITIQWQVRDIEFNGALLSQLPEFETLYDTVKIKFRVPVPPTGTSTVSVTGYTMDFIDLYKRLANDATALAANCTSRFRALLVGVNQPYLTGKLDAIDAAIQDQYTNIRQFGRFKLRKKN
jgi:hypothetical protein